MPWGQAAQAVVGTVGSVASGIIGAGAARDSAGKLVQAGNTAIGTERGTLDQVKSLYDPYMQGGKNAFSDLQSLLGIGSTGGPTNPLLQLLGIGSNGQPGTGVDPTQFRVSPGYEFAKQEGLDAVTKGARGNLGGNTLRALMQQGTGMADQGWQQYLGNVNTGWNSLLSGVQNVSNTGFNATNQFGADTLTTGHNIAGDQMAIGSAEANGIQGSAQAWQGMIKGIVSALSGAAGGMGGGGGGGMGGMMGGG